MRYHELIGLLDDTFSKYRKEECSPDSKWTPSVISVPRAEMCSNVLLFYDAFRGLCRLRIDYAENKANKMLISAQLSAPDEAERLFQKQKFWLKVQDYWKFKLELSYKWEKDYFRRK